VADPKMHPYEVDTDAPLVRRLLAAQFPQWAALPVRRVESTGTDNAMFRIGSRLCARLPRIEAAVDSLRREKRWLPGLAARLPLTVPVPLAVGAATEEYPYPWSVLPWIDGEAVTRRQLAEGRVDPVAAAVDLAGFLKALHAVDTDGAPAPVAGSRGGPISGRDQTVRAAVAELASLVELAPEVGPAPAAELAREVGRASAAELAPEVERASASELAPEVERAIAAEPGRKLDATAVLAAWDRVMATPPWPGEPVWVHADLQGGNLIACGGRLAAVIDFGPALGDPAVDLLPAWNLFEGRARDAFRAALDVDEDTWERGRGWALSIALVALPYYLRLGTNPRIVADSWHVIDALLEAA
jgi:aminoglycoside phosphotransferase (APT) family kinase protein